MAAISSIPHLAERSARCGMELKGPLSFISEVILRGMENYLPTCTNDIALLERYRIVCGCSCCFDTL